MALAARELSGGEESDLALAFGDAGCKVGFLVRRSGLLPDLVIEMAGFLPEGNGFLLLPQGGLQESIAAERVGQVEGVGLRVTAVDAEGFFVAGQSEVCPASSAEDVGHVADGVGEQEWVVEGTADGRGFLVMMESGFLVAQIALNLAEAFERLDERGSVAGFAAQLSGLCEEELRIGGPALAARLVALSQ